MAFFNGWCVRVTDHEKGLSFAVIVGSFKVTSNLLAQRRAPTNLSSEYRGVRAGMEIVAV